MTFKSSQVDFTGQQGWNDLTPDSILNTMEAGNRKTRSKSRTRRVFTPLFHDASATESPASAGELKLQPGARPPTNTAFPPRTAVAPPLPTSNPSPVIPTSTLPPPVSRTTTVPPPQPCAVVDPSSIRPPSVPSTPNIPDTPTFTSSSGFPGFTGAEGAEGAHSLPSNASINSMSSIQSTQSVAEFEPSMSVIESQLLSLFNRPSALSEQQKLVSKNKIEQSLPSLSTKQLCFLQTVLESAEPSSKSQTREELMKYAVSHSNVSSWIVPLRRLVEQQI